ncbi:MAG TPA: hypothetical protein VMV49_12660 [Candidatus Deferrimicrobium sp.]|nr:hypothetical protein [Candidatus Deferrimicrobium sp.]
MNSSTKKLCEGSIQEALAPSEINILKEIIQITKKICKNKTNKDPAFLLIGMRALYFYFGREAFHPALISIEIDLNFDILVDWAPFRHRIPNLIKENLEPFGYYVKLGIGLISILKNGLLIDLTVIFENKDEYLGSFIPELQIHAGDKNFLIYSKLSRGDPVKDLSRLKSLFHNCKDKIDLDKIYSFAYEDELELIKSRVRML